MDRKPDIPFKLFFQTLPYQLERKKRFNNETKYGMKHCGKIFSRTMEQLDLKTDLEI